MKKALSLLALLATACGGQVADPTSSGDGAPLPARGPDAPAAPLPAKAESVSGDVGAPTAIALDGDRVVFTTRTTLVNGEKIAAGALFVADKRVGPALMIDLDRRGATFDALATDGTTAFVTTSDGRLVSVPLLGGDETHVADLASPAAAITTAGDNVYLAYDSGEIVRVAKTGGAPESIAKVDGAIRGLVADDAAVYAASAGSASGAIVRVAFATKEAKAIATAPGEPCAVVRDDARLFWTSAEGDANGTSGTVRRVATDGADLATVAQGAFTACALASDATSLYFATTVPGALPVRSNGGASGQTGQPGLGLMRAPVLGGEPVGIPEAIGALAQPGAVAVDATHLYWLTSSAVMRLRK